jgi:cysteine desulfuration protein SufE
LELQTEENKVRGCQSNVWLVSSFNEGKIFLQGDSDALIVKGLVALVLRVLSGKTPDEILNTQLSFIERLGMQSNLSPTRNNGLAAMIKQIKFYALAYKAKTNS